MDVWRWKPEIELDSGELRDNLNPGTLILGFAISDPEHVQSTTYMVLFLQRLYLLHIQSDYLSDVRSGFMGKTRGESKKRICSQEKGVEEL